MENVGGRLSGKVVGCIRIYGVGVLLGERSVYEGKCEVTGQMIGRRWDIGEVGRRQWGGFRIGESGLGSTHLQIVD